MFRELLRLALEVTRAFDGSIYNETTNEYLAPTAESIAAANEAVTVILQEFLQRSTINSMEIRLLNFFHIVLDRSLIDSVLPTIQGAMRNYCEKTVIKDSGVV